MASAPLAKRIKTEPISGAWHPCIDQSLGVLARDVALSSDVSSTYQRWQDNADNRFFFNITLRTSNASNDDSHTYPAHAAAIDLASHSDYFDRRLGYNAQNTLSSDAKDPGNLVLGLEVHQRHLHAVISSLYKRSVSLSPATVEHVLMVAQYLSLQPVMQACKEYLVHDMVRGHAPHTGDQSQDAPEQQAPAHNADAVVQAGLVVHSYADWMLPELLDAVERLPWSSPGLQRLLDEVLSLDQAREVLSRKKAEGYVCEAQVLDCLKGMPSKRATLLQHLVDFKGMHALELEAVMRYAAAMTQPAPLMAHDAPNDNTPARGSSSAGTAAGDQSAAAGAAAAAGTSASSLQSGSPPQDVKVCREGHSGGGARASGAGGAASPTTHAASDSFWPMVLSLATSTRLNCSLRPPEGLQLFSLKVAKIRAAAGERQALQTSSFSLQGTPLLIKCTPGLPGTPNENKLGLFLHHAAGSTLPRGSRAVQFCFLALYQHPGDQEGAGDASTGGEDLSSRLLRVTAELEPPTELGAGSGWGLAELTSLWADLPELQCRPKGEAARVTLGVAVKQRRPVVLVL